MSTIGSRRHLIAVGGYIAANLAIPLAGVLLGIAFAALASVFLIITGLARGNFVPTDLSLATLPLYFGFLVVFWSLPAVPGVILALPFIVLGEIKGIRKIVYYLIVGGLAAAAGCAIATYLLWHWDLVGQSTDAMVIPAAVFGVTAGVIYWRFVGRHAGGQTAASP